MSTAALLLGLVSGAWGSELDSAGVAARLAEASTRHQELLIRAAVGMDERWAGRQLEARRQQAYTETYLALRDNERTRLEEAGARLAETEEEIARTRAALERQARAEAAQARARGARNHLELDRAELVKHIGAADAFWQQACARLEGGRSRSRASANRQRLDDCRSWRRAREAAKLEDWATARAALLQIGGPWPREVDRAAVLGDVEAADAHGAEYWAALGELNDVGGWRLVSTEELGDLEKLRQDRAEAVVETSHGAAIDEKLRATLELLEQTGALHGGGTLAEEARALADEYDALIAAMLGMPESWKPDTWEQLFWRAGTASLLAGDTDLGWSQLRQGLAVAGRLPLDEVPPSMHGWLAQAALELMAEGEAMLRVETWPGDRVQLDGRVLETETGREEWSVLPGWHLLVITHAGDTKTTKLLPLHAGDVATVRTGEPRLIERRSEDEAWEIAEARATLSGREAPVPEADASSWHASAVLGATLAAGQPAAVASLGLGRRLGKLDLGVGAGALWFPQPLWLTPDTYVSMLPSARATMGLPLEGRLGTFEPLLGAAVIPLVGGGPLVGLTWFNARSPTPLEVGLSGAWDLAPHEGDVARGSVGLTVGARFGR